MLEGGDDTFHLRIKSFKDVELAVPAGSVVAHVKQQIRAALAVEESPDQRPLRLICKGRLLSPDDHPISDFNVKNGDVVHAVLAPIGLTIKGRGSSRSSNSNSSGDIATTATAAATTTTVSSRRRHRNGTLVGPGGRVTRAPTTGLEGSDSDSSDDDEDGGGGDEEQGGGGGGGGGRARERRGFDRLRSSGLRRSEITAIRSYFSRQVDRYVAAAQQQATTNPNTNTNTNSNNQPPQTQTQTSRPLHMDEPDALRRRYLFEEDWMNLQGPTSEFRMNLNQNTLLRFASLGNTNGGGVSWGGRPGSAGIGRSVGVGTDRDFLWGFMLGYFVGFAILLWVWMPTVPHKQKIGILTGISFQLAMNSMHEVDPQHESQEEYYTEQDFG